MKDKTPSPSPTSTSTATDWIRTGTALNRRYRNVVTGEEISRRQFDKRFGALAKGGFTGYEQKAKANITPENFQLLKPARGRKIFNESDISERIAEAKRRKFDDNARRQRGMIERKLRKNLRKNIKIPTATLKKTSFKYGNHGRYFVVPISYEGIGHYIWESIALNKREGREIVFGYMVGVNYTNSETGREDGATLVPLSRFDIVWNEAAYERMLDELQNLEETSYALTMPYQAWVYLRKPIKVTIHEREKQEKARITRQRRKNLPFMYK